MAEMTLPVSSTGRKYGYITWAKAKDAQLHELLGDVQEVELVLPGGTTERKRVDWKHHRISVGYSVTRSLPPEVGSVKLVAMGKGRLAVTFG